MNAEIPSQIGEREMVHVRLFDVVDEHLLEPIRVRKPSPYLVEFAGVPPGKYRLLTWYGDRPPCDIFVRVPAAIWES